MLYELNIELINSKNYCINYIIFLLNKNIIIYILKII